MQKLTRREFMLYGGAVLALPHLPLRANTFAYVASGKDSVRAFRVHGERWTPLHEMASVAPACVVRVQQTLHVANDVESYERLPRGSVESFHIGPDGRLTPLVRTALSLSATHPRSMAVSPDGTLLAVAAHQGGIYNLFALASDGRLGPPCGIFKDIHCTHPDALRFDASGKRIIATDSASRRLSVVAVEDGRFTGRLSSCLL